MKKVFGLLFVAGLFAFASCNNTEEAATETEVTEETVVEETPVVEDSTALEADTTVVPVDSAAATL
ncbi:hypothetical protein ACSX1A_15120 [Pontibacter sp. MBLB2868]|uniref:hypothetical protein n=1 Tax=Pontibacter sp. MBLB2868 TaxID=3451555 RepID=UPI003F7502CA